MKLLTLLAVLLPLSASAQTRDVEGWGQTKWGMTEAEVKGVVEGLKGEPVEIYGFECKAGLARHDYEISGVSHSLELCFDVVGELQAVAIRRKLDAPKEAALETLLVEQYGAPTLRKAPSGSACRECHALTLWCFRSTTIEYAGYETTYRRPNPERHKL